jgi:GxxExxY protein
MERVSGQRASESQVATQYAETTYKVIGAAMRVHNALGPGLKEAIYQSALSAAMRDAGLSFEEEKPVQITLDDEQVGLLYLDHLVEDAVVVEEKAISHLLTNDEVAQVITYLKATEKPLGLLLNFGRRTLEYRRILPPKVVQAAASRMNRLAWRPTEAIASARPNPLIGSASAESQLPGATRSTSADDHKEREADCGAAASRSASAENQEPA